jgi:Cysteine-rich CWC
MLRKRKEPKAKKSLVEAVMRDMQGTAAEKLAMFQKLKAAGGFGNASATELRKVENMLQTLRRWRRSEMRDADVCPTCGGVNDCGMEKGASTCWCFTMPHVFPVRTTEQSGGCYCHACLTRIMDEARSAEQFHQKRCHGEAGSAGRDQSRTCGVMPPGLTPPMLRRRKGHCGIAARMSFARQTLQHIA